jgi:ABC-type sugar transport system permease subunit
VSRRRLSEPSFAFLLNAPALLAIVGLVGYPIAYSLWLSLHRYNLKRPTVQDCYGEELRRGCHQRRPRRW